MSRRQRFFKNGLLLTAVAVSARAVSLFFGAFVTRTVGAEGIGLFTLIMTLYNFAVTFASSGVSLTVTKLVAAAIGEGRRERVGGILRAATGYALFSVPSPRRLFSFSRLGSASAFSATRVPCVRFACFRSL